MSRSDRGGKHTNSKGGASLTHLAAFGHQKPAAEFFRLATEHIGLAAGEIGFIDDVEANIEAARQFGWKAMQWTSGSKLRDAIAAFSHRQSE
ncbi:putative haloacid dehydrogenase hydrolase [Rhizobium freirei PRF 81]|uniref:Putative haloacid dehydrogenase hydrolase n=1 Tax=Rhizobium freirei PRF 81 TaxID=363754 RepID=N6V865_9HYPH|nr:HAD-IA family hydrolase [Rhizobium freirei]ENN89376.1 putative haloacid dehydrogenase hydrolase [Rhizobium freirei PRF 81]